MELRQLTTERERRIFGERMEEARAKRGGGFRERRRSSMAKIHFEYGRLYGLFEHDDDPPEQMMSGFVIHDLASYPQSHPRPDLSHLPPRSVIEGGELWSFAKGAGLLAQRGSVLVAGLMQVRAVLVYAILKPVRPVGPICAGQLCEGRRSYRVAVGRDDRRWPNVGAADGAGG